jgi:hypothetical protein
MGSLSSIQNKMSRDSIEDAFIGDIPLVDMLLWAVTLEGKGRIGKYGETYATA